jgi:excisionase family DNA binding protein
VTRDTATFLSSTTRHRRVKHSRRFGPDRSIASILNRLGVHTAKGLSWTQERVRGFRRDRQIAVYRDGERAERGEIILHEAATRLGVSKMTVVRLIKDGLLPARAWRPGSLCS